MIVEHIVDAVRERSLALAEDDAHFGPVQVLLAVADGCARAGFPGVASDLTAAADRLADEASR